MGVRSAVASPVTAVSKTRRKVAVPSLVGLALVLTNDDADGGVRSIVMAPESASVAGPVLPGASVTASAARRAMTVPSEQPEALTVMLVPDDAEGVNTQPVAVPWLLKSPEAMPDTGLSNARVNDGTAALVGDAGGVHVAVGGTASKVTAPAVLALPGAVLPAASVTAPGDSVSTTVPVDGESLDTLTV